jgi:hypothetical protein
LALNLLYINFPQHFTVDLLPEKKVTLSGPPNGYRRHESSILNAVSTETSYVLCSDSVCFLSMHKPHGLLARHIFCQYSDDFTASESFTNASKEHAPISIRHIKRVYSGGSCGLPGWLVLPWSGEWLIEELVQSRVDTGTVMDVFLDGGGIAGSTRETPDTFHLPLQTGAGERSQQYENSTRRDTQKPMNSSTLLDSALSTSIRYEKSHEERFDSGFYPRKLLNLFTGATKKSVYSLLESCEQRLYLIQGLEKAPNQHMKDIGKTCKMWYLRINNGPIHAHCIERSKQEIKNLFLQLAISIAITAVVVGLVTLLGNNSRAPQEQNAESLKFQASWRNSQMHRLLPTQNSGSRKGMCDVKPEKKCDNVGKSANNSFFFRQKWKPDPMVGVPRRKIKDLFDLESLGSRNNFRGEEEGVAERIPVLPRAHNASVRLPGCIRPSFKGPHTTDSHVGGHTIIDLTDSSPQRHCLPENSQ